MIKWDCYYSHKFKIMNFLWYAILLSIDLKVLITELKKFQSNLYTPSVLEKGKSAHAFNAKSFWGPHAFTTTQRRDTAAFSTM